jgi:hypothetical protein
MANHLAPLPLPLSTTAIASAKTNGLAKSDGSAHSSGSDHWLRYAQLRGVEDTKNNFIQDILTRLSPSSVPGLDQPTRHQARLNL